MFAKNTIGRKIPLKYFGRDYKPYCGSSGVPPSKRKYGRKYKPRLTTRRKIYDSLDKILEKIDLKDGMTVGFHHCLRFGDFVINMVMDAIAGFAKNLTLASTALFPNHEPLLEHIESGVIGAISGSMNGPIGKAVSTGAVSIPTSLRSHGGRARAVECGELHLDVSFIAASACDELGNMNGCQGPSAFGANGFGNDTDSVYADTVVIVTDNLLTDEPVYPVSIKGANVDYVVTVDQIGDPNRIVAGSLGRSINENHLAIAEQVIAVAKAAGYIKDGLAFQAGAGGVSLATTQFLHEIMLEKDIVGSFVHGGTTAAAVKLLEEGLFHRIYDGQSFDRVAANSLRENSRHIESSADISYNIWKPGGPIASYVDVVALGATEIDVNFNVNVNTFSNGILANGIGGHTDAAAARMTVITCPLARKVPIVIDKVTTVSTPGEMVDVLITDGGIAVNPQKPKLKKKLEKCGIQTRDIHDLRDEAYSLAAPLEPELTDEICTVVEYRDGTLLDIIRKAII
ncbi:MAG: citrate lyase subunit alpha [Candidatus Hodarchaeales archaeon]|jgi:citrate lyase subunit alpha/citrate CoA-transferase